MKPKVLKPSDLVKWRKKNGYSQITLDKALGVTTMAVYRWEKVMRAIPSFLHLTLKYLEMKGGDKRKTKRRKE